MDDMTDEEAIAAVYDGVNALFAAHREVREGEPRSYVEHKIDHLTREKGIVQHYAFVTFCNGAIKEQGSAAQPIATLRWAVEATIKAVAEMFPTHAERQVIWRDLPGVYREPARDPDPRYPGLSNWPMMHLYMRLVATPLGV